MRAKPSPEIPAVDVEAFKCVGEKSSEDGVAHKEYRRRGASSLKHRVRDLNDANCVFTAAIKVGRMQRHQFLSLIEVAMNGKSFVVNHALPILAAFWVPPMS